MKNKLNDLNSSLSPLAAISNNSVNDSMLGATAQAFKSYETVSAHINAVTETANATKHLRKVIPLPSYKVIYSLHPVNSVKTLYCILCHLIRGGFFMHFCYNPINHSVLFLNLHITYKCLVLL